MAPENVRKHDKSSNKKQRRKENSQESKQTNSDKKDKNLKFKFHEGRPSSPRSSGINEQLEGVISKKKIKPHRTQSRSQRVALPARDQTKSKTNIKIQNASCKKQGKLSVHKDESRNSTLSKVNKIAMTFREQNKINRKNVLKEQDQNPTESAKSMSKMEVNEKQKLVQIKLEEDTSIMRNIDQYNSLVLSKEESTVKLIKQHSDRENTYVTFVTQELCYGMKPKNAEIENKRRENDGVAGYTTVTSSRRNICTKKMTDSKLYTNNMSNKLSERNLKGSITGGQSEIVSNEESVPVQTFCNDLVCIERSSSCSEDGQPVKREHTSLMQNIAHDTKNAMAMKSADKSEKELPKEISALHSLHPTGMSFSDRQSLKINNEIQTGKMKKDIDYNTASPQTENNGVAEPSLKLQGSNTEITNISTPLHANSSNLHRSITDNREQYRNTKSTHLQINSMQIVGRDLKHANKEIILHCPEATTHHPISREGINVCNISSKNKLEINKDQTIKINVEESSVCNIEEKNQLKVQNDQIVSINMPAKTSANCKPTCDLTGHKHSIKREGKTLEPLQNPSLENTDKKLELHEGAKKNTSLVKERSLGQHPTRKAWTKKLNKSEQCSLNNLEDILFKQVKVVDLRCKAKGDVCSLISETNDHSTKHECTSVHSDLKEVSTQTNLSVAFTKDTLGKRVKRIIMPTIQKNSNTIMNKNAVKCDGSTETVPHKTMVQSYSTESKKQAEETHTRIHQSFESAVVNYPKEEQYSHVSNIQKDVSTSNSKREQSRTKFETKCIADNSDIIQKSLTVRNQFNNLSKFKNSIIDLPEKLKHYFQQVSVIYPDVEIYGITIPLDNTKDCTGQNITLPIPKVNNMPSDNGTILQKENTDCSRTNRAKNKDDKFHLSSTTVGPNSNARFTVLSGDQNIKIDTTKQKTENLTNDLGYSYPVLIKKFKGDGNYEAKQEFIVFDENEVNESKKEFTNYPPVGTKKYLLNLYCRLKKIEMKRKLLNDALNGMKEVKIEDVWTLLQNKTSDHPSCTKIQKSVVFLRENSEFKKRLEPAKTYPFKIQKIATKEFFISDDGISQLTEPNNIQTYWSDNNNRMEFSRNPVATDMLKKNNTNSKHQNQDIFECETIFHSSFVNKNYLITRDRERQMGNFQRIQTDIGSGELERNCSKNTKKENIQIPKYDALNQVKTRNLKQKCSHFQTVSISKNDVIAIIETNDRNTRVHRKSNISTNINTDTKTQSNVEKQNSAIPKNTVSSRSLEVVDCSTEVMNDYQKIDLDDIIKGKFQTCPRANRNALKSCSPLLMKKLLPQLSANSEFLIATPRTSASASDKSHTNHQACTEMEKQFSGVKKYFTRGRV